MSGNFAIKGGGGGRTPNGKCHLKFPFWFFAHLPYQIYRSISQIRRPKRLLFTTIVVALVVVTISGVWSFPSNPSKIHKASTAHTLHVLILSTPDDPSNHEGPSIYYVIQPQFPRDRKPVPDSPHLGGRGGCELAACQFPPVSEVELGMYSSGLNWVTHVISSISLSTKWFPQR